ncbi:hypothetical protein COV49_00065 [Candidatus Falkowbacteria bacterium CG11_big_fil_rev_8_21_14_0_20_39_10]|uniref:NADH-ubiquinone oxidoreductase 51kDa subunit iron-sulphur binding domain-containing protein n=1 Tax=Candidatus Falkowbacteria bacterium CG11_big_fil_rev_8_21_14_0_20_39_10 TaxID=1974570 RepID=A0A2M6KAD0_9BACT|nr:MAG: hypothetical protein COV49_00065 [Candidatus Falkowbacteria bacterium CG11_big_fil_rev_8_21_14_0_20_39_10]
MKDIIKAIKRAGLIGRGGACFPTAAKWTMVKDAPGKVKYVVCNAAEGEPGIKKDGYILENYPDRVIDGLKLAIKFLGATKAYIYLNPRYYKKLRKNLEKAIGDLPIEIFKKDFSAGYIGGEESSALNHIEGKRIEPRLRPPFPPTRGLMDCPTLINNVETFYNVSLVNSGEYKNERFYTVGGDCLYDGVYKFGENLTIERILKQTGNWPRFNFFVQVGGDASGEVLNSSQLRRPATGGGSITIYSLIKHRPNDLLRRWLDFFTEESCGQCTPCREGVYRLREILDAPFPDWKLFGSLLKNLHETAICGLGSSVPIPIESYVKNVLIKMPENEIRLKGINKKVVCECFN